jgi:hypothetical protein
VSLDTHPEKKVATDAVIPATSREIAQSLEEATHQWHQEEESIQDLDHILAIDTEEMIGEMKEDILDLLLPEEAETETIEREGHIAALHATLNDEILKDDKGTYSHT